VSHVHMYTHIWCRPHPPAASQLSPLPPRTYLLLQLVQVGEALRQLRVAVDQLPLALTVRRLHHAPTQAQGLSSRTVAFQRRHAANPKSPGVGEACWRWGPDCGGWLDALPWPGASPQTLVHCRSVARVRSTRAMHCYGRVPRLPQVHYPLDGASDSTTALPVVRRRGTARDVRCARDQHREPPLELPSTGRRLTSHHSSARAARDGVQPGILLRLWRVASGGAQAPRALALGLLRCAPSRRRPPAFAPLRHLPPAGACSVAPLYPRTLLPQRVAARPRANGASCGSNHAAAHAIRIASPAHPYDAGVSCVCVVPYMQTR
jgi:hypothetical protein